MPENSEKDKDTIKAIEDYMETFEDCFIRKSASEVKWKKFRNACKTLDIKETEFPLKIFALARIAIIYMKTLKQLENFDTV